MVTIRMTGDVEKLIDWPSEVPVPVAGDVVMLGVRLFAVEERRFVVTRELRTDGRTPATWVNVELRVVELPPEKAK